MLGRIELPQSTNHRFDLTKVLDGTQDFRWRPWKHELNDDWCSGVLNGHIVHVRQLDGALEYRAHTDLDSVLTSYFRLDEDLDAIYATLSSLDPHIASLVNQFPHLRLLRQPDPWECTVAYICSRRTNLRLIAKMVNGIAKKLGQKLELCGNVRYAFPSPEQVREAGATCLEAMNLGLTGFSKHNKIIEAAHRVCEGKLDFDRLAHPATPYLEAKKQLMHRSGNGIGDKIADCIALFSLDKTQAFPVDSNIKSAIRTHYGASGAPKTDKALGRWASERFGHHAGYASQLFFQSNIELP